jgi:hypothetical protein
MAIKALLLAAGLGTRLRPYTTVLPKPLMPIGDRAILDVVVRQRGKDRGGPWAELAKAPPLKKYLDMQRILAAAGLTEDERAAAHQPADLALHFGCHQLVLV